MLVGAFKVHYSSNYTMSRNYRNMCYINVSVLFLTQELLILNLCCGIQ